MKILCIPVGPLQANCYVVSDDHGHTCAIDPGGEPDRLARIVQEKDLELTHVLLTHGHIDHLGGAGGLARLTGALIGCAAETAPLLRRPDPMMPIPGYEDLPGIRARPHPVTTATWCRWALSPVGVVATPGHSPGDLTFHIDGTSSAATLLFYRSVGRTDFPGGDFGGSLGSVQKLVDHYPRIHRGPARAHAVHHAGRRAARNPFLRGLERRG